MVVILGQEAGCRRLNDPETVESPDREVVALLCARMIFDPVD
jgi:hypothetical protein